MGRRRLGGPAPAAWAFPESPQSCIVWKAVDFQQACRLADLWVEIMYGSTAVVLHDSAIDKPYGWVFFYQSKRYVESGDLTHSLFGNSPIVINRFTNELRVTGTARPLEHYLDTYERSLPAAQRQALPEPR